MILIIAGAVVTVLWVTSYFVDFSEIFSQKGGQK
ncbi:hypothetical protein QE390_000212 [Siphonobacter sp. SORGH_AS 1065]|nr:hypothetical protein [Siphonobacter sp. SORGH_AS_1065]